MSREIGLSAENLVGRQAWLAAPSDPGEYEKAAVTSTAALGTDDQVPLIATRADLPPGVPSEGPPGTRRIGAMEGGHRRGMVVAQAQQCRVVPSV